MDVLALKSFLFLLLLAAGCCTKFLPEGPIDASLGKNVTFTTLLKDPVYSSMTWIFNNGIESFPVVAMSPTLLNVDKKYEGRVSVDQKNGQLTLKNLQTTDSGTYALSKQSTDLSTMVDEIELRVLEAVSNVIITSDVPDAIEHKSTVVLTCTAKGSFLKFAWTNNGKPIIVDGVRVTQTQKEHSNLLTIRDVLRSDLAGPIYCHASNAMDTQKSDPFSLMVYYGPEEVTISPPSTPQYIESSAMLNLTCSARSNPPAKFKWMRNGALTDVSSPILSLKMIKQHKFKGMGAYKCVAFNSKTNNNETSKAVSFEVIDPITGVKISGPPAGPPLLAGKSSANISCQVATGTVDSVEWLKDDKPLAAGGRVAFSTDRTTVMIKPLQKEDNGKFTCKFKSKVNTAEGVYKMVVNYGPEKSIVKGPTEAEVNTKVMLTCSAMSVPAANYTWKLNGTALPTKGATYIIENAMHDNSGNYTCEVYNPITKKTTMSPHTLTVKDEILDGLSDGAIAGIVIGVIAALAIAIGLFFYCRQKIPVESPY
ncbi:cell adhesion molecule CEACAM20 [Pholidichthys leucotaenia]